MPYNLPTVTTDDISFGPARVFLGLTGTTPTTDIGSISEDGVTLEATASKKAITQGNPKIPIMKFTQEQGFVVKVSGIEWNFDNFARALGAGVTGASGSAETFAWGGDPLSSEVALHVQHYMATSGDTMNVYVWKATGEGGLPLPMGHDEHKFDYSWEALLATTNWAGAALPAKEQLYKIERAL